MANKNSKDYNIMKITLKRTPEQLELIKAMASKNRDTAYAVHRLP